MSLCALMVSYNVVMGSALTRNSFATSEMIVQMALMKTLVQSTWIPTGPQIVISANVNCLIVSVHPMEPEYLETLTPLKCPR